MANDVPDDNAAVPVPLRGDSALRTAMRERFPDLASDLDDDDGIHLAVAALARYVMEKITANDIPRAASLLSYLDEILRWPDVDPEIENAVAISFVEPAELESTPSGRLVWDQMPPRLRHLMLGSDRAE